MWAAELTERLQWVAGCLKYYHLAQYVELAVDCELYHPCDYDYDYHQTAVSYRDLGATAVMALGAVVAMTVVIGVAERAFEALSLHQVAPLQGQLLP